MPTQKVPGTFCKSSWNFLVFLSRRGPPTDYVLDSDGRLLQAAHVNHNVGVDGDGPVGVAHGLDRAPSHEEHQKQEKDVFHFRR